MTVRLVVATRRSPLALAQARAFVTELCHAHPGLVVEELHVVTTGDRIQDRPLSEVGGKGLFVKEIEEALLDGRADLAVHSSKDVPAELPPGLVLGCVPPRADPRDAVVVRGGAPLASLAAGARLGTSSLRRRVQLALAFPGLEIVPLRGNVDTRLRRSEEGTVDAVVLASAGLERLGLGARATERLEPSLCLPAVGQGALAIEIRAGDARVAALLAALEHETTRLALSAERGVLRAVEGSCQVPIAAFAEEDSEGWRLRALLAEPDGSRLRRRELRCARPASAEQAEALGLALGVELRGG
ncbi:MAG: hydroxymethylbilane synthase [Polyangiaceae bacterium]|nr:hydroxymethylbilane synthase [Polyangiaceae bacterium]